MTAARSDIEALERAVQKALADGDESGLRIIGYGEVSTVVEWMSRGKPFACKRLTPFRDDGAAVRASEVIDLYMAELREHGVDVADTQICRVAGSDGRVVVYCVQAILPSPSLGPNYLREKTPAEAAAAAQSILTLLRRSVTPRLAPDGQLSNWAFVDGRIVYLDVSSPFLRDDEGNELFDFAQQMQALPAPLRFPVSRFVIKGILDTYHSLRGQALDFLGNLKKERLEHLIPTLLPVANRVLHLDPVIREWDVSAYYAADARVYAWLQAARRADRWFHRHVLYRPYGFLLPPRVERNL